MRPRCSGFGAAVVLGGFLIAAAVAVVVIAAPSDSSPAELALPPPPRPAFTPENVPLGEPPVAYWAPVVVATTVRDRPAGSGAMAEVATRTPEGTANLVLISGRSSRAAGRLWIRVRAAGLPDDVSGWVPRSKSWRLCARADPARGRPGPADGHSRSRRAARVPSRRGHRCPGNADAGRPVLRPQQAASLRKPLLRAGCVRHECPLGCGERLAGRRLRGDPRH